MIDARADAAVVIPTYNRADCIRNAIDSALAQTLTCREVIVVDDGSTDETPEVLRQYGDSIKIVRQQNSGVSAARNAGIAAATGDWIAFLDSDDEWEPDKIERQMQAVTRDDELIALASNGWVFARDQAAPTNFFSTRQIASRASDISRIEEPLDWVLATAFMTPGVMARRTILQEIGGFDPHLSMFEDMDLLARLALRGPFGVDSKPLFRVYRRGPDGESLTERSDAINGFRAKCLSIVYTKLLASAALTRPQRTEIRRKLSAVRAEYAVAQSSEMGRLPAIRSFAKSIADHPSLRSGARAFAGIVAGARGVAWARRLGRVERPVGFTRS